MRWPFWTRRLNGACRHRRLSVLSHSASPSPSWLHGQSLASKMPQGAFALPPSKFAHHEVLSSPSLEANCATNTAATTRERRAHSSAGRAGVLSGAIERARSGRQRHARRRRGRLDAEVATRVGILPPIRASARVEQHEQNASVGRVETDLGWPTGRVPASELPCVCRGAIAGRFCQGSIACRFVDPGIRAAVLRSDRSS